ncbi:MAG: T9SS type A sorting domain-containing protein [Bacteroidota bacterium]
MKKIVLFSLLAMMLQSSIALCHTWETITYGYWNHASVWSGGVVPPYNSGDTVILHHRVAIEHDLYFTSGGLLHIDTLGGLCGHQNLVFTSGSELRQHGIMEIDSLFLNGGNAWLCGPDQVILLVSGTISGGGQMQICGASLQVGAWFDCRQPDFFFTQSVDELDAQSKIYLFPNPASSSLNIKIERPLSITTHISIFNSIGAVVLQEPASKGMQNITINIENLSPGLYYLNIGGFSGKFVKE